MWDKSHKESQPQVIELGAPVVDLAASEKAGSVFAVCEKDGGSQVVRRVTVASGKSASMFKGKGSIRIAASADGVSTASGLLRLTMGSGSWPS